jgi:dipeptidyl-peptidase III
LQKRPLNRILVPLILTMNIRTFFLPLSAVVILNSCNSSENELPQQEIQAIVIDTAPAAPVEEEFQYAVEQFSDLRVLRYHVPGFEELPLKTKELLYYLYQAALSGRDILWDQNFKYNLMIRRTLEGIISNYKGDVKDPEFEKFMTYAKRVFFSNGIHHHYANDKILPECSKEFFASLVKSLDPASLPKAALETPEEFSAFLVNLIYDPSIAPKKVSSDASKDLVLSSAVNFYEGVTEKEVTAFYEKMADKKDLTPISVGLNTKLVKENGQLVEKKWMVGGMYDKSISQIVNWLDKAVTVAENAAQKEALEKLSNYYKTGDLEDFDDYCLAWIRDTASVVDVVNGFIEVYNDPLGRKGSFESVVSVKDMEASKRIATIGANAQWFEDNSTLLPQHKKKKVTGISAKVINAVVESGDSSPSTPIGINLPNADWIRKVGSKSVNLGNIVEAFDHASGSSTIDEFYYNDEIRQRVKDFAPLADKLHTDMHEVIGHASGQIEDGVGQTDETLKSYASALEEGRADLVALYYLYDQKLVDLGVMPSLDYGKAAYDEYITKGLMVQLSRIKEGNNLEEAHMRNRQMVAGWAYEKGKKENVIEKVVENGKTFFVVRDYSKLRVLFGELLREIQRVKSQGDYKAGRDLIENYGVKVEPALHKEVLARFTKLGIAPYSGFIQPKLVPVFTDGKLSDVKIEYPKDFIQQMLEYGKEYSFLPTMN